MLEHGHYMMGPEIKEFEAKLQDFIGTKYYISVASGAAVLLTNLTALGIQPREEPANESGLVSRGSI